MSDSVESESEAPDTNDICIHFQRGAVSAASAGYRVSQLQHNATTCDFCAVMLEGLSTVLGASLDPDYCVSFKLKHQANIPPRLTYEKQDDFSTQQRFEISPVSEGSNLPRPLSKVEPFLDIAPEASSEACVKRIQFWLDNCQSVHGFCAESLESTLPRRVLEVDTLVLHETQGEKGKYIALSHCWGSGDSLKTEKSSIGQRKQGIQWDELPQTFQDAITISKALGVQYLWIDSLCIVQDDQNDWEVESGKMDQIYKNSYITIAASVAKGDHEGFLRPRTHYLTSIARVELSNGVEESFKIRPLPAKHYRRDVGPRNRSWRHNMTVPGAQPQPLETRAWCFQERLVSSRLVSFCEAEMEWDYPTLSRCECGTRLLAHDECFNRVLGGMEPVPGKSSIRSLYQSLLCIAAIFADDPKPEHRDALNDLVRHHWHNLLIPSYTLLALTRPSDRLPALSAIASELKEILKDDYLCGLWRQGLTQGITWVAGSFGTDGPQPGVLPQVYRAPSWSWASTEGPVDGDRAFNSSVHYLFRITEARCTPMAGSILGPVTDGSLTIEGDVIRAELKVPAVCHGDDEHKVEYRISTPDGKPLSSSFYPDTPLVGMETETASGTVRRSGRRLSAARDSIDAPVLCLVLAGHRTHRLPTYMRRRLQEREGEEETIEGGGVFDSATLMVLGLPLSPADFYQRLGLARCSWSDIVDVKVGMTIEVG
ncbi:hypothetical protein PV08_08469 [Exophiala spinifera]|uniref:Heterokaryon incompatibility domain-containing protein n=1 Tax=Exophiala spinifera TaxID=91928 RepID=A0A0D1YDY1_9EURO|nr:uncharacterized protein PV08_08469 [Exophiala spinifera]KIW13281.1 hypothetical protein PV08_08469 [Exophiala spinifera]